MQRSSYRISSWRIISSTWFDLRNIIVRDLKCIVISILRTNKLQFYGTSKPITKEYNLSFNTSLLVREKL